MAPFRLGARTVLRNLVIFVVVVVFLLAQGPAAWRTIGNALSFGDRATGPHDVISTERAKELSKKGLRGQVISFSGMEPLRKNETDLSIDRRYEIFAIPVEQISLDQPEKVGRTGAWRPENYPYSVAPHATSGRYSNILLFDRETGNFQKLFDARVSISQFQRGWNTKPEVLVIFAAEKDTDRSGTMDDDDMHDVYIVTLADRVMHRVTGLAANPIDIVEIPGVAYLVVRAKVDRNEDGRAPAYGYGEDEVPEPDMLFRIDLKTFVATPFVPDALLSDLQQTLDASEPAAVTK